LLFIQADFAKIKNPANIHYQRKVLTGVLEDQLLTTSQKELKYIYFYGIIFFVSMK